MRWKIQLEGDKKGLEQLSESFDSDPKIFEESGDYYLWSSEFKECNESGEVQDVGNNLVKTVRHLGMLDSLRVNNLDASGLVEIQEDGSERSIVVDSTLVTATATASVQASVDGEEPLPRAKSTYENTQLALKDDKVQKIIEMCDKGDHWSNLYRIYEYIQGNTGSENNIVEQGWWSESEKDLFKQTANSPEAIGHEARHGDTRVPAPSDPMNHAEAKALIHNLIDNWLKHRKEALESGNGN